jgi:hypothetical protein
MVSIREKYLATASLIFGIKTAIAKTHIFAAAPEREPKIGHFPGIEVFLAEELNIIN